MPTNTRTKITVETSVKVPVEKAWELWTAPEHIVKWNNASDDWHTPRAENDVRAGGKFLYRMEARSGGAGFDFGGVYDEVSEYSHIAYTIGDGRKVRITFTRAGDETKIVETFEAESTNSVEMQRNGWQAILDNFRKYAETGR